MRRLAILGAFLVTAAAHAAGGVWWWQQYDTSKTYNQPAPGTTATRNPTGVNVQLNSSVSTQPPLVILADLPSQDVTLAITNGATSVSANSTSNYDIVLSNPGSGAVTGTVTWSAAGTGVTATAGAASCTSVPATGVCNPAGAQAAVSLPAGQSMTIRVPVSLGAGAGSVTVTGTFSLDAGFVDPDTSNNTGSDTDAVTANATDLAVSVSNGASSVVDGTTSAYVVTFTNTGAYAVTAQGTWSASGGGATSAGLVSHFCSYVSAGASCSTSTGALYLPAGGRVDVTMNVRPTGSPGTLTVTAQAAITTAGISDSNTSNNTAQDADNVGAAVTDVSVSVTDGRTTITANTFNTWAITVSNVGAYSASISVAYSVSGATISSASCSSIPSGGSCSANASSATVLLPPNRTVSINVSGTTGSATSGSVTFTASATITTASLQDSNTANNAATDTDGLSTVNVDTYVSISNPDAQAPYGATTNFQVTFGNVGPQPATAAYAWNVSASGGGAATMLSPTFYSQTGGASYSGFNLSLPAGSTLTFNVPARADASIGSMTLSASVTPAGSLLDTSPGNNSMSLTVPLAPGQADVSIVATDSLSLMPVNGNTTYTVTVRNNGGLATTAVVSHSASAAAGASVASLSALSLASCTAGSVCSGSNMTLAPNGQAVYTATLWAGGTPGSVTYTATATVAGSVSDPNPANNSASDTNSVAYPLADLAVTVSAPEFKYGAAQPITVTVFNYGASGGGTAASNATGQLSCSATGSGASVSLSPLTCASVSGGSTCAAGGAVNLANGGQAVYQPTVTANGSGAGTVAISCTISLTSAGATDPNLTNNTASVTSNARQAIYKKYCVLKTGADGIVGESFHDFIRRSYYNYVPACNARLVTEFGSSNSCWEYKAAPGTGAPQTLNSGVVYWLGSGWAGYGPATAGCSLSSPGGCYKLYKRVHATCNMGGQDYAATTWEQWGSTGVNGCSPATSGTMPASGLGGAPTTWYLVIPEYTPSTGCMLPGAESMIGPMGPY